MLVKELIALSGERYVLGDDVILVSMFWMAGLLPDFSGVCCLATVLEPLAGDEPGDLV